MRTVTVDAVHGLRINGVETKLKGGCLHHVTGITGAASFREQDLRMLRLHKEAGYNAVRCAHNPPRPASSTYATSSAFLWSTRRLTAGPRRSRATIIIRPSPTGGSVTLTR
ncbi:MAG: hypothetical protein ACLU9S_21365 [Oscillospiraceae bacterium]